MLLLLLPPNASTQPCYSILDSEEGFQEKMVVTLDFGFEIGNKYSSLELKIFCGGKEDKHCMQIWKECKFVIGEYSKKT